MDKTTQTCSYTVGSNFYNLKLKSQIIEKNTFEYILKEMQDKSTNSRGTKDPGNSMLFIVH